MPRLRFVAKVAVSLVLLFVLFKILGQQPPPPPPKVEKSPLPQPPAEIPPAVEDGREPTEAEMLEIAKKEEWIWKDFPT